jgi:cytidylate kinase
LDEVTFLPPTAILKNFFTAIESVRTRRREEVESIVLAKKLVEALNEQERNRSTRDQTVTSRKGGKK